MGCVSANEIIDDYVGLQNISSVNLSMRIFIKSKLNLLNYSTTRNKYYFRYRENIHVHGYFLSQLPQYEPFFISLNLKYHLDQWFPDFFLRRPLFKFFLYKTTLSFFFLIKYLKQ